MHKRGEREKVLNLRKRLSIFNLILALVFGMYVFSLITNTKIPMVFPLMSLTIILGGFNSIKVAKPNFVAYLSMCIGIL